MANIQEILQEDNSLAPISNNKRYGVFYLLSILIGCTICVPVFLMGSQMASAAQLSVFLPAVVIGGLISFAMATVTGIVGQKTGLTTALLTRHTFGTKGHLIACAAMSFTAIGWFGIQISVFSEAFSALLVKVWGVHLPVSLITVLAGVLMSSTAIIGYRGLGKLSMAVTPLLILLLLLPLVHFTQAGAWDKLFAGRDLASEISFGTIVAIVVGAYSFAFTMPDITRFCRRRRDVVVGMFVNFIVIYPGLMALTGILAILSGQPDFLEMMLILGFGALAVVVLFLATWSTNDTNVYAAAVSANIFVPHMPRWVVAAASGALGTFLALMGILDNFMGWLIFTGNLFAPMAGVYVLDYWLDKNRYETADVLYAVAPRQICAWLLGTCVALLTTSKSSLGLEVFELTTVPAVDGVIAGALALYILRYIRPFTNHA